MAGNFLKRLEINGFKSFASKTILEFPEGITAIVGPNGSGKSNVIDAIRWLLGERDAKNLRGAKVEDLIFGGTPSKPRLGQAQACLYFENKNNFFPTEFAEVSILRQVSRDGTSQYFLNKSEIRLKDLIDFFARARLGSKGLTVIGQGESDIFITSTPQGRREMIEEMLGLREYQIKKAEAERRLKNAHINLDKARALMEEIVPHLRSLKRQASRWGKRSVFEEELKALEDRYFGSQKKQFEKELQHIDADVRHHEQEMRILEEVRKEAEKHLGEVEAVQPKEREELLVVKKETQELLEKRGQLQKELGRLEIQIEMSKETNPVALPSSERLFEFIKKARNSLQGNLEKDAEELRQAVKLLVKEIEQILNELPDFSKEKMHASAIHVQLEKVMKESASLEKDILELKDKEGAYEKGQESFYISFKEAVGKVESAKDAIERWENVHQQKLFSRERLMLRIEEIHRQIMQAGRRPEEFAAYAGETQLGEGSLAETERKIFKLRGDLASIGEVDEALVTEATETESRYEFLKKESEDLDKAERNLKQLITELNEKIRTEFGEALVKINQEFTKFFKLMFNGGHARLKLEKRVKKAEKTDGETDAENRPEAEPVEPEMPEEDETLSEGIEIEVGLPRKKIHSLEMLSGGERSLTAIAALFAMISVSPPPFLVLDEVDAALDERNAKRFAEMLKEFAHHTQFVIVTHNRATMEAANVLYGVTMNQDGTSKVFSLKLEPAVVSKS